MNHARDDQAIDVVSLPAGDPGDVVRTAVQKARPGAAIIVDFDETLWLRNSTEEYLRSLRPRFLAYLALLTLDLLRPWRVLASRAEQHLYRDWIRVLVCTVLMPWSLHVWRRQAPTLAAQWRNDALLSALRENGETRLRIATLGTEAIVAPLLRHIDPDAELIAAGTFWAGHRIRRLGKGAWIESRYGREFLDSAVVITDSETDADLLRSCHTPLLLRWPDAEYRPALSDVYVPFLYTQRGKRPGANYMLYGVLLEDVMLLWLAFAWIMPDPVAGAAAILLFHLSFWAVYEIGYVENDTRAAAHEVAPETWGGAGAVYAPRVKPAYAWAAAAVFALPAAWLLTAFNADATSLPMAGWSNGSQLSGVLAVWSLYLITVRAAYAVYNRLDVATRGVFYVVLQLLRTVGYGVLLKGNLVGMVALLSLVLARWVKYLVYRDTGSKMPEDQRFLAVLFFAVLGCAALAVDPAAFWSLQAAAVLLWLGAYAHRRIRRFLGGIKLAPL